VVTAPELSDGETRQICHARGLTCLQAPGWGETLCAINGWDAATLSEVRAHRQLRGHDTIADSVYHRAELAEPSRAVPDAWMTEACAIGSVAGCADRLQRYRDAGADEIVVYGSTPAQNEARAGVGPALRLSVGGAP
jgi:5,10-methylenetetrahydromethanopterin reductase